MAVVLCWILLSCVRRNRSSISRGCLLGLFVLVGVVCNVRVNLGTLVRCLVFVLSCLPFVVWSRGLGTLFEGVSFLVLWFG